MAEKPVMEHVDDAGPLKYEHGDRALEVIGNEHVTVSAEEVGPPTRLTKRS